MPYSDSPRSRSRSPGHASSTKYSKYANPRQGESILEHRVYVNNLTYEVGWRELADFMSQAGKVIHADVLVQPSGKSKGCAIVEFENAEGARNAVATLNDTMWMGRKVFVREDRVQQAKFGQIPHGDDRPIRTRRDDGGGRRDDFDRRRNDERSAPRTGGGRQGDTGRELLIDNLPYQMSWQDVKDYFRDKGYKLLHAEIDTNADGRSAGKGRVVFSSESECKRAFHELQDKDINGRKLFLKEPRGGDRRDRVDRNDRDRRDRGDRGDRDLRHRGPLRPQFDQDPYYQPPFQAFPPMPPPGAPPPAFPFYPPPFPPGGADPYYGAFNSGYVYGQPPAAGGYDFMNYQPQPYPPQPYQPHERTRDNKPL